MAEAAIGFALGRLALFLEEEARSIHGFREKVEAVERKLRGIQCFLKNADGRSAGDSKIEHWVTEMRQVAYEIEDVIDLFVLEVESYYNRKGLKGRAKRSAHKLKEIVERREINSKIEKINKKIEEINQSRVDLDIRSIDEGGEPRRGILLEARRRDSCEDGEHDVVGLEEKINELVKRLVEGEGRRCVISVVGQVGVGKTVLARKVYNRAKSSFGSAAWIHVSTHPNEVLRELCKAVLLLPAHETEKLVEAHEMRLRIARKLMGKKYLVVLDDVWENETWDAIRGAFPDGNSRSRVLITTQNEEVAKHADTHTPPYRIPLLDQRDSYKLLCKHAFPASPQSCPQELQSLANDIVAKCGGLPLALVAVGRILSGREPTVVAWKDFVDGFNWDITQGKAEISRILTMGFDDLHYDLKPCLLYCCAFPGDSEIRVKRLLRLWIAEGFVKKQEDRRPDAVAMHYLNELVARNLIQPCKRNSSGEIKSCRVHDVLRVTLAVTAKKQNFFQIDPITPNNCDLLNCRRLATHRRLEEKTCSLQNARSILSFPESKPPLWSDQIKNFKLLRVLDLEGVRSVEKLPVEIGDLVLLIYLGLRHTSIETLPRSVKKLSNLQTLDLRTSANVRLSHSKVPLKYFKAKHVAKMTNLRHLYFGSRSRGELFNAMEVPEDFGVRCSLKELQTLSYVKAGGWVEKGLCTMTNLRKLGMQVPKAYGSSRSALGAIAQLGQLHSLYLQGELENLLDGAFVKLTKLTLDSSCLHGDPFSGLQTLQLLKSLRLINAYGGNTLCCSGGGFPCLEVLNLENLKNLRDVVMESGAFRQLKFMRIASCGNLHMIPRGLVSISSLQELRLVDMAALLPDGVQPNMGTDWHITKATQLTIFTKQVPQFRC
ncbi:Disease resistance protein [Nymphaea thermarum]|nr:Disease resistance protein [Nymphaea thermarum]